MTVDALGFGGTVKALWIRTKQQYGGIGRVPVIEKVEVSE
jgi:hypothetical protein